MSSTVYKGEVTGSVDDEGITVRGRFFAHTTKLWRHCTNRHRNSNGTSWGWIDGAPGDDTWSDDKAFDSRAARIAIDMHNQWLEDQKPVKLKLIEANDALTKAARRLKAANEELDAAEREHRIASELIESLERIKCSASIKET